MRGADGEIECLVTTGLDITERERRAEKLGKLAAEQAALRRVAVLVASDTPPDEVFAAVAEEICGLLGIPSVVILRFEQESPATIVGHFSNHHTPSFESAGHRARARALGRARLPDRQLDPRRRLHRADRRGREADARRRV